MHTLPNDAKQRGEAANKLIEQLSAKPEEGDNATPHIPAAAEQASSQEVHPPITEEKSDAGALQAENAHLKQALSTLQGKYSAEVPTLSRQLKEARAELHALREVRKQPADQTLPFNVDSIEQEYGADMAAIAKSAQSATEQIKELSAMDEARRVANEQAQAEQTQQQFNGEVEKLIPDFWEKKNNAPAWHNFLASYAPNGETWMEKAEREMANLNAQGVASIYSMFETTQKTESPAQPHADPSKQNKQQSPVDPREQLVPPTTTGGGEQGDKKVWTQREVNNLYAEKDKAARGQSQLSLDELEELERDFFAAQNDGRYRPDL